MKYTILIAALSLVFFTSAQDDNSGLREPKSHAVGLHAGFTTGLGFSYRFMPKKLGLQLTTAPFFNTRSQDNFLSLGASVLYKFFETRKTDLFGYVGNHYISTTFSDPIYNVGVGAGLNLYASRFFYFSFQAGYGVYSINNFPFSNLTGEFGLYFKF
jgi:hypothetical protein